MRLHLLQKGERAYNKDLVDFSFDKVNRNEIGRTLSRIVVNDNEKRVEAIKKFYDKHQEYFSPSLPPTEILLNHSTRNAKCWMTSNFAS